MEINNSIKTLEKSLMNLKRIVNAQPKVADKNFFNAALDYKRKRKKIVENKTLQLNEIKPYDEEYHMLTIG